MSCVRVRDSSVCGQGRCSAPRTVRPRACKRWRLLPEQPSLAVPAVRCSAASSSCLRGSGGCRQRSLAGGALACRSGRPAPPGKLWLPVAHARRAVRAGWRACGSHPSTLCRARPGLSHPQPLSRLALLAHPGYLRHFQKGKCGSQACCTALGSFWDTAYSLT